MLKKSKFEKGFLFNILLVVFNLFFAFICIFFDLSGIAIIFILCGCAHMVGAAMNAYLAKQEKIKEKFQKIIKDRNNNNKEP